ncbi:hypothetical protein [Mycobacteroides abscessus]|uniref:hypothetical protein n=1 Tax=Mycobacteroides abscessus TaxID=36809 RepID=UPI000945CB0D|nr:hypothetical protein [Mycobacteroides abscessus]MDO2970402.1 hypothetical protein [Mycobacteroides abscessus subsp. bolletii]MDO3077787.1 hypothetical protein [Mycobacteroides abscessus subsp. bolletii]MDO3334326.1 hypothetical protein [Mycobacteroides abscessus subsp. bolletii]QSM87344.1 hypothetical protein I3U44_15915 [Mycobacteroides abscessus subsp. bolletii]
MRREVEVGLLTRIVGITALALGLMGGSPMSALADPDISADPNPYPDVNNATKFRQADFEQFLRDDTDGAWFSTPRGLNCAIWIDGSFGCNGSFPGAPAGTNQVAWFPGDWRAHFDVTGEQLFTPATRPPVLTPGNYFNYRAVKCAVTTDGGVYCFRGHSASSFNGDQFYIAANQSWLGETKPRPDR